MLDLKYYRTYGDGFIERRQHVCSQTNNHKEKRNGHCMSRTKLWQRPPHIPAV